MSTTLYDKRHHPELGEIVAINAPKNGRNGTCTGCLFLRGGESCARVGEFGKPGDLDYRCGSSEMDFIWVTPLTAICERMGL